jgi:putative transposase
MPSTYASLHVHIVFSVKHRAPAIQKEWIHRLHDFIGGIVRGLQAQPIAIGGVADHVHLLIALKPTHCLADVVRDIKRSSSNWIVRTIQCEGFHWQSGYAAF